MSAPREDGHPVEAISALADGELGAGERAALEAHLAVCASCRGVLEDFRSLARALPEAEAAEPPAGLAARVRARIDAEAGVARRRRFVLPVAAAATLAAVALLATLQYRRVAPEPARESSPQLEKPALPPPPPPFRAPEPEAPRQIRRNARSDAGPGAHPAPAPAPAPAPVPRPRDVRVEEPPVVPEEKDAGALAGTAGAAAPAAPAPQRSEEMRRAANFDAEGALACARPWRAPGDYAWREAPSDSGATRVAALARAAGGDAVTGRDARGDYVTLRVPAAAWPELVAHLRELGARVPDPAPAPPAEAACVAIDVRLDPPNPP